MEGVIRIAIGQINCTVGDLEGNGKKIVEYIEIAKEKGADIVTFPELTITGYPPEDLIFKQRFVEENIDILNRLSRHTEGITAVIGFVDRRGGDLFNAASVIQNGKIVGIHHKHLLPNYSVFDEERYFKRGKDSPIFEIKGVPFGVNICEDIWQIEGPTRIQVGQGARFICNISASPFYAGKRKLREETIQDQAKRYGVPIIYTNLVGGQDELVFDGQSVAVDRNGNIVTRANAFREDLLFVDLSVEKTVELQGVTGVTRELDGIEEVYEALKLGLSDYVRKNGFNKVILGLSGGIDSSLVATIAADALGRENVIGVSMPSMYTSQTSIDDGRELAERLGITIFEIPIEPVYHAYLSILRPFFAGREEDITEENIQARIRGNILMAISNKFGYLVLITGNKSEMSVGYATLYGDMAGGLGVIKDVPKTMVYELARYRNRIGYVIPERVLVKAPTAELRYNQKDSDSLPPYEILDPILKAYIEEDKDKNEIISSGFEEATVEKTIHLVDRSEYKRRQSPPGIKITPKSFGKDRRMPITNKYRG
ncbi:MAG: NAD+ synthase [Syntrophorhabdaceae bacterium]|nr:NAD+ synthase [Syntrophorhabdaceae bacterium]